MKFGVALPAFLWPGEGHEKARRIKEYAQRAESLGFDSLWATEHLLTGEALYAVSRLEPLAMLSYLASCTEKIKLGTSILILPLRHPVILAKEIAALDYLSGGRFILGVGAGWDDKEFAACGIPKRERGSRTDEALEILRRLLTERGVTHHGQHWQFDDVTIEPLPPQRPLFWVGGGSQLASPYSPNPPTLDGAVLKRIARADGWISRPTAEPAQLAQDWQHIQECVRSLGRDLSEITFAIKPYLHVVPTADRQEALAIQRPAFERVMGRRRPWEDLARTFLVGSVQDIARQLEERRKLGPSYCILSPVTDDPGQLELWAREIVPHFC